MPSRPVRIQTPDGVAISRRALIVGGGVASTGMLLGRELSSAVGAPRAHAHATVAASPATGLTPTAAIPAILAAMDTRPLVGIGEYHAIQDFHDVIGALLHHPDLPTKINDIVVEFGSARYQPLADRFVLDRAVVPRHELVQIWRQVGDVIWNAPVYEQFFHTVRAINWMLPPQRRIRVLLGQPPVTMADLIARPHNRGQVTTLENRVDRHYATVVEREVLAKGRRALMIAGDGHMLKGLRAPEDHNRPNAATALEQHHPGSVYSIDLLLIPPNPTDTALQHFLQTARTWPQPSILPLAGTPLGAMTTPLDATNWINSLGNRAISPATRRYDRQADAILWLGPGAAITASQTDPAIYHWGTYPDDLRRLDPIIHANPGEDAYGLSLADAEPNWFAQFQNSGN